MAGDSAAARRSLRRGRGFLHPVQPIPCRRTIEPIRSAGPQDAALRYTSQGRRLLLGEPCCAGWLSSSPSRRPHVFLPRALLRLPRARPLSAPRQLHPRSCSSMRPTAVHRSSTHGTSRIPSPTWVARSRLSMRPARRPTRPSRYESRAGPPATLFDPDTGEFLGQKDALHAHLVGTVADSAANRYRITGTFFDDGSRHVLPGQDYYGIGHVAIKGSAGRVVGKAILYRTTDGGDSWSIDFTRVDTLHLARPEISITLVLPPPAAACRTADRRYSVRGGPWFPLQPGPASCRFFDAGRPSSRRASGLAETLRTGQANSSRSHSGQNA